MIIARIKSGWAWLEDTLNGMIAAINANQPLSSASIAVEQSPNGTILRVVKPGDQQPPSGGGGAGQSEFPSYALITLYDVFIQNVTIVDPATCAQSTITVYVRSPGNAVKFGAAIVLTKGPPPAAAPN